MIIKRAASIPHTVRRMASIMPGRARPSGVEFGEGGVAQEQALFADVELYLRHGLVSGSFKGQDRSVAEAGVVDLVPHADGNDLFLRLHPVLGDESRDVGVEAGR